MRNNRKSNKKIVKDVSAVPTGGLPEDTFDMVNNYGTYEIQATSDTENRYPAIAQGFNKEMIKTDCSNKDAKQNKKFQQ